jgi:hypothetical protein
MTTDPVSLFTVMKQEIGQKCNCIPFALKAIESLNTLQIRNEREANQAANRFLSDWQTLSQGGLVAEDYDKVDFVKRGGVITISARVEAFIRAAARKGYRVVVTVEAVPTEDSDTTYYKEHFHGGDIVYILEDKRINGDRAITPERLIDGYFAKFLCRLDISDVKTGKRLLMTTCEMSNSEVMKAQAASDNGLFATKWVEKRDSQGNVILKPDGKTPRMEKAVGQPNTTSIWWIWTGEMVKKTIVRRALKLVREALPELKDSIYAFDKESDIIEENNEVEVVIPVETVDSPNVDLNNLTKSQQDEVSEMFELFKANPKLAQDKANEIMAAFYEWGKTPQELINEHYAIIANLRKSKNLSPMIQPLFESEGG